MPTRSESRSIFENEQEKISFGAFSSVIIKQM
jgi:hypothetical protein